MPRKIKSKRREKERENTCKLELIRRNRDQLITNTSTNGTHDGRSVRSVQFSWHHKNYQRISESNPVRDSPSHSQNPNIQPPPHTQTNTERRKRKEYVCVCLCLCVSVRENYVLLVCVRERIMFVRERERERLVLVCDGWV